MAPRARTLPMLPLSVLPELTEADGLMLDAVRTSRTGSTLLGPGPICTPDRTVGVGIAIQVGDLLAGKYEASSLIGTGGDSFVMAAHHRGFDSEVALKFFNAELVSHDEARRRFAVELRSNQRMRSEHIVRVYDVDSLANGQPFMVMERLHGYDLRVALQDRGRLTVARSLEFGLQICEALATAHAVGIVHLDLKPENLFVTGLPHAELLKVLDFGSCREPRDSSHRVATLSAQGSPPYMSPEQMRGSPQLDERSDLWSLGCVLYEMLTGRSPFKRRSLPEACAAVLEQPVRPLRELRPELPEQLESVVLRCLEKDPDQRPDSVLEVAELLGPLAPHCARHVRRCRQIMAEHDLLRTSGVHVLTRARSPAPAPQEPVEARPRARERRLESGLRRSTRVVKATVATGSAEPHRSRSYGARLGQLAGLGLFVLASYASLRPSPRAQVAHLPDFVPGSMCEVPAPVPPAEEPRESLGPIEPAVHVVPAPDPAELRHVARRERREQARREAREQERAEARRARLQALRGNQPAPAFQPAELERPY